MFGKKNIEEKRSVLFVDDDRLTLNSQERCLQDEPYHKLFAKNSKEVFEVLKQKNIMLILSPSPNFIEDSDLAKPNQKRMDST